VRTVDPQNEIALRARLAQSRDQQDRLTRELRTIEEELEALAVERSQFALLHDVCSALEKLDERDAADLFWQGLGSHDSGRGHLRSVRERVDGFEQQVSRIESARQAVLARIASEEEAGEILEDDLYDLKCAEEDLKNEWIVERDADLLPKRPTLMPWARGGEDDERFRRTLRSTVVASLLIGVVFPLIPLPVPDHWEVIEVPERFARLIREERPPPPLVPELRPDVQEPEPERVEETPVAEETTPEPTAPEPAPKPKAATKGILALRDQFSGMADSTTTARLGSQARIKRSGTAAAGRPTRSLVTTPGPGTSGGIDLASLSRDLGGGEGIEGVQVARATSTIASIGGGMDRPLAQGPGAGRTDEEIQIVFDRHKAALYRLYNRELRRDPTLQGQVVLRLTIEPDGSVSFCEVKSSDIRAPKLAMQVVARVKTFDFGAKDGIPAITILYPIDFLPAT
jgi:outer membrane biosynthesis protein TonB